MTSRERLAVRALLFDHGTEDVDLAYLMTHDTKATDKDIIHKMALRWLREPEVTEYVKDCGYKEVHTEGNRKCYIPDDTQYIT